MNRLQRIDSRLPLFVTPNPDHEPDVRAVFAEFTYSHPQFSAESGQLRLFSVNRWNLVSFQECDHAGWQRIRGYADELLTRAGLQAARILLVCHPRIFGFVFNPLAVYYAYDDAEDLIAIIYEVRNMFGGPLLTATFSGRRFPLTTLTLAKLLVRPPLLSRQSCCGHPLAPKLWLKGIRYITRRRPSASCRRAELQRRWNDITVRANRRGAECFNALLVLNRQQNRRSRKL
jgi:DUF1365 family protein